MTVYVPEGRAQNGSPTADELDTDGLPRLIVGPTGRKRDRMAVSEPKCTASPAACAGVVSQLRRNLGMSALFEILDPATHVANAEQETLSTTNWGDWFNVGARFLVKASMQGSGPYSLEMGLYDVMGKKRIAVKGQQHTNLKKSRVRKAVNEFVNGVILAVTGSKGLFGTRFIYAVRTGNRTAAIGSVELDGGGQYTAIGGNAFHMFPHFTARGLLYTSFRSGKPDLWIGDKQLTHDEFHYRGADYSGSGRIAASLSKGNGSDIYVLDKDGAIVRQVTDDPAEDISPEWSPSGSQIAFVSDRSGGPQVYVIGAAGGSARRITMAGSYNTNPDWGPNNKIAFTGYTATGADVFTVQLGGSMSRITQDQGMNINPTWSRDGRYIAFISDRKGGRKIWVASADGRWQFPVTQKSARFTYLKWSR